MKQISFYDWGKIEYNLAWTLQEELLQKAIDRKLTKNQPVENKFIFCEHPHVFTIGKSGKENNLLIDKTFLKKINATIYHTNRGGDITYHGPGQIVGYPIINLDDFGLGVRKYIELIEEVIIRTLSSFGITASRMEKATGVWIDANTKKARKIAAIGVRVSRGITMHGFAFNINTNLKYFSYINPCGFTDKGVTSLERELGKHISLSNVKEKIKVNFKKIFLQ